MSRTWSFAAADLGATSGRVILGSLRDGRMELAETVRFDNTPQTIDGHLHWDADLIVREISRGFANAQALAGGELASLAVDTWGVDYGRLGASGLIEPPYNYRDARTDGVVPRVLGDLGASWLYERAGLQVQQFNTIFQFASAADDPRWGEVERVLLMPDLLSHLLGAEQYAEVTMASTTGLLDVARRAWSPEILAAMERTYGVPLARVLPGLVEPGTRVGEARAPEFAGVPIVAVGGHDTASAVVAVPAAGRDFAYISSGTWSLVGLELDAPVLTPASEQANFTNELGVDGTVRYLKNVMGLWVIIECRRDWKERGLSFTWPELVDMARAAQPLACVLDMADPRLLHPGGMPARLQAMASETGQMLPDDPASIARCVFDSLALAYRRSVREACALAGHEVSVVHIVGGGSNNELLCQLTADACGLPVVAGPGEGTALGNLLVQARAAGAIEGGLDELRAVAAASSELKRYEPGGSGVDAAAWESAERRIA